MKAYLAVTATLFALVTLAHLWRVHAESTALGHDGWFMLLTALAAALSFWGYRLLFMMRSRS